MMYVSNRSIGQPVSGPKLQVKTKFYAERFLNELLDYKDNTYNTDNLFFDSTQEQPQRRDPCFLFLCSFCEPDHECRVPGALGAVESSGQSRDGLGREHHCHQLGFR